MNVVIGSKRQAVTFSDFFFFWKINLDLLWLGELLGHKSKYAMAIFGQMIPVGVLAWLFI